MRVVDLGAGADASAARSDPGVRRRTQPATAARAPASDAATLRGSLQDVRIADVLQFLHGLGKSGHLLVEREGGGDSASVYVAAGRIVHAFCPPLQGRDCVYALLGWRSGRYVFIDGPVPEVATVTEDVPWLLLEGLRRQDELERLRAELPPDGAVLHRCFDGDALGDVALTLRHARLLDLVDGRRTLRALLELPHRDPVRTAQLVRDLLDAGLLRPQADDAFLAAILVRRGEASVGAADPQGLAERMWRLAAAPASLAQLGRALGCGTAETLGAARTLVHARWLEVAAGAEAFARYAE